jgi:hypothetical protein
MGVKMVIPVGSEKDTDYRYTLHRYLGPDTRLMAWVMLNPSTADEENDDPTIRRVKAFTAREGYGRLVVVNLFAKRCTDPKLLFADGDPTGPLNGETLVRVLGKADAVVAAWGSFWSSLPAHRRVPRPNVELMAQHTGKQMLCLGTTASGDPKHPLYIGRSVPLVPYFRA